MAAGMLLEGVEFSRRAAGPPPATTSLSPRGGSLHRTMKESIISLLQEAGPKGLTIAEIAEKLDVLRARVQAWFSGTGKRTKEVKKIGVGRWRYVAQKKTPL